MRENDLRVIKTRESIEYAMMELLKKKWVSEITVTELSKLARISKGTFYLHYQDIYDLYEKLLNKHLETTFTDNGLFLLFFDDPARFFTRFDETLRQISDQRELLIHGDNSLLVKNYIDLISQKLYETGRIKKTLRNDLLIQSYFAGLQHVTQRFIPDAPPEIETVMTAELQQLLTLFE